MLPSMIRETTYSVSKIADLAGVAHLTARKRLTAGGAAAEPGGRYSIKAVLRAWEQCAAGRIGATDAAAAKLTLANLKIEAETIAIRRTKGELVEVEPYWQFLQALTKTFWAALQSAAAYEDTGPLPNRHQHGQERIHSAIPYAHGHDGGRAGRLRRGGRERETR